jgi:ADP-L-glycero-D-manno-heptose 6-epimerase
VIVVTGGAGFIGSNLVHGLNAHGRNNILVVDYLEDSQKFLNIRDAKIADYIDQNAFLDWLVENGDDNVEAVFHLGACSDMSDRGSRHLMSNNYQYSKEALDICLAYKIPFIYASSAAVYGAGPNFSVRVGD